MIREEVFDIFPLPILKKINRLDNVLNSSVQELKEWFFQYNMEERTIWGELAADEELCQWLKENIDPANKEENAAAKLLKCLYYIDDKIDISVEVIPLITIKLIDP